MTCEMSKASYALTYELRNNAPSFLHNETYNIICDKVQGQGNQWCDLYLFLLYFCTDVSFYLQSCRACQYRPTTLVNLCTIVIHVHKGNVLSPH